MNIAQASLRNVGTYDSDVKGEIQGEAPPRMRVPMRSLGAEQPVRAMKFL